MPDRIIEFFGLPGAGKSTRALALAQLLRAEGMHVTMLSEIVADGQPGYRRAAVRLTLILSELLRNPRILSASGITKGNRGKARVKAVYNTLTTAAAYAKATREPGIVIADQGWLQAIWSIRVFSQDTVRPPAEISEVLEQLSGPNTIVLIEATPDIARFRLAQRESKHSRMQNAENSGDDSLWQKANAEVTECLSSLPSGVSVVRQDAEAPLDNAATAKLWSEITGPI